MAPSLKQILENSPLGVPRSEGPIRVLIELKARVPDAKCMKRLQALGLKVKETIGNKIIGSVEPNRLEQLRADPDVLDVETSVPLELH